jgi:hypothetical protein
MKTKDAIATAKNVNQDAAHYARHINLFKINKIDSGISEALEEIEAGRAVFTPELIKALEKCDIHF